MLTGTTFMFEISEIQNQTKLETYLDLPDRKVYKNYKLCVDFSEIERN